jgi:hypothetical protein
MLLRFLLVSILLSQAVQASVTNKTSRIDVLVVVGAPGEKEFEPIFSETALNWTSASKRAGKNQILLSAAEVGTNQLTELQRILSSQSPADEELWIVLVGHGTFDGREAKFNLEGPDLSATEAGKLITSIPRPVVFINTSSSSAPFLNEISGTNRIVITATKSGWEENYARFGKFLSKTVADPEGDIDKDGQVSVLEAFLTASRQVEEFYSSEKRLATEHSLIDDNGDKKGTGSNFFRGVRATKKAEDNTQLDGFRAHQIYFLPNAEESRLTATERKRRNELELSLESLRPQKEKLPEAEYLKLIEPIVLELSRLYQAVEQREKPK